MKKTKKILAHKNGRPDFKEIKGKPYSEALEKAKIAAFPGEELKEENFNRVNTDGFEKAVVLMKCWTEMLQRVMFEKHSFRIEINYNAEANKTDFAIYTSAKDEKDSSRQEHSDN